MPIINEDFMALTEGLDTKAFWEENALCNDFTTDKPRCALHFSPDDHWIHEFEDVPSTLRYYRDVDYRNALHAQVNRTTMAYVGKVFFSEDTWEYQPKRIENLFGSEFAYHEGGTPWLTPVTDDPDQFERVLDQAEATDMQTWALPEAYLREWDQRKRAGKPMPKLGSGSRGPATVMTSILRPEDLFIWMYDYPDLMLRFRDLLADRMVAFNNVLRAFSGNTRQGWWITDDNSALFNRKLYRTYCFPVLQRVMDAFAPGDAPRYQHSDSAMGHIMSMQYELGIRSVNYGPEVDVADIRATMPEAMINGHMPPFVLRNGTPDEIKARLISDFEKAGATGGLTIATAGSTAAGTGVGRMRYLMLMVQEHCRYD